MNRFTATALMVLVSTFGAQSNASAEFGVEIVFSANEIKIIDAWYRDSGPTQSYGGGHKKNKGLPPGIAKNLQRGKPLPPGIAKRFLPTDLRYALPAPHDGYERLIIGGKILLVEIATGVIHDILTDAMFH
jgi:Ni/Co efflux regulator RcnB